MCNGIHEAHLATASAAAAAWESTPSHASLGTHRPCLLGSLRPCRQETLCVMVFNEGVNRVHTCVMTRQCWLLTGLGMRFLTFG